MGIFFIVDKKLSLCKLHIYNRVMELQQQHFMELQRACHLSDSSRKKQLLAIKYADIMVVGFWTLLLAVLASVVTRWCTYGLQAHIMQGLGTKSARACVMCVCYVYYYLLLCYVIRNILEHCPRPGTSAMALGLGYDPRRLKELSGATAFGLIFGSVMAPTFRANLTIALQKVLPPT
jgi:hypothetical protein